MKLISKNHNQLRELIRSKIQETKEVKVGVSSRTGGKTNKDIKIRAIADTFGVDVSTLRNWRGGYPNIGRQRLYALLYALDDEMLDILTKEFTDE